MTPAPSAVPRRVVAEPWLAWLLLGVSMVVTATAVFAGGVWLSQKRWGP